ncbi:MAG: adenylate/guanylate cyclase domain-containing protein, partial [Nitriliruptorales bacterium]|nr:adenylate/guanylate cyclase domain-containing protein [Nitriliruptorales bacterium]
AVGVEQATITGTSEGASVAMAMAVTRPERVRALALFSPLLTTGQAFDLEAGDFTAELRRYLAVLPEEHRVSEERLRPFAEMFARSRENWGTGEFLSQLVPSLGSKSQLAILERAALPPSMLRMSMEAAFDSNSFHLAAQVRVPAIVFHARGDIIPVEFARYLAELIPGARLVETDGRDHAPWLSDSADFLSREFEEFVTGTVTSTRPTERVLSTVLFADIVGSTARASSLGDQRWRSLLESFRERTGELVNDYGGEFLKDTGDGLLATFVSPLAAVRAGQRLAEAVRDLDLEVRVGVHTGEVERTGNDVAGLAVHIGARIMALAEAGEVLASRTVRDLVAGGGVFFESRGTRELKGVPGTWEVVALAEDDGGSASRAVDNDRASRWFDGLAERMARVRGRRSLRAG